MRKLVTILCSRSGYQGRCWASALGMPLLVLSLILLPSDRTSAYTGSGPLPIGSVQDYLGQGQSQGQYPQRNQYMRPRRGAGYYGYPNGGYRYQQPNPAAVGVMLIALWAMQRYQERHHHHAPAYHRPARHLRGYGY